MSGDEYAVAKAQIMGKGEIHPNWGKKKSIINSLETKGRHKV